MISGDLSSPFAASTELSNLRWLAKRVLDGTGARLIEDLPDPALVSRACSLDDFLVRDYVVRWALHPDRGGAFARRTRWLRRLPRRWLARLLLLLRYDGVVYRREGRILGHVFFQRHGDALHGFSTAVAEHGGRGQSVVMMLDYVAFASQFQGIARARIGRGQNNVTRRLLERLQKHELELGWRVRVDDGWIDFAPQQGRGILR